MARLNIEDKVFKEQGFQDLMIDVRSRHLAKGIVLELFQLAQEFWFPDMLPIPMDRFKAAGLPEILFQPGGLCELNDSGVYVRGSKDAFQWLFDASNAGKKSAEVRKAKTGSAQPKKPKTEVESIERPSNVVQRPSNGVEEVSTSYSSSSSYSLSYSKEVEEEESSSDSKKPQDLFKPTCGLDAYNGMTEARKTAWMELYPDEGYVCRTVNRAFIYYFHDHPKSAPTSRRGWSKAFSHWLEKGWADWCRGQRETFKGTPLRAVKSGTDWEAEATRLLQEIKRFGSYDSDEKKQSILGYERWYWLSRSGVLTKVRQMPDNDWSRKQLARDLKEGFEAYGSQVPAVNLER